MLKELVPIEWSDERVLTTKQLAEAYGVTVEHIKQNFRYNKEQFVEGRDFVKITGQALRGLKQRVGETERIAPAQPSLINKLANCVYLWKQQGAARHAKMLRTPNVLEIFEQLRRDYFGEEKPKPVITPPKSDFPYFQPSQESKAAFVDDNNVAQFNAEWVARQLGWTQTQLKNGREYTSIRWERMNQYLAEFGFPQIVGEKDFIPENMLYRLIWKSHDDNALKFQSKVADEIMPSIRKYGYYSRYPESDKIMREVRESAERLMATTEKPVDTLPPFDPERAHLLVDLCNAPIDCPFKEQLVREIANFIYGKKLL